jgi:hypothetical protein
MKATPLRWPWLALLILPGAAAAHFFTQPYTLPVPFTMYAYGATAALALSFVIVGVFATVPSLGTGFEGSRRLHQPPAALPLQRTSAFPIGRTLSVFLLLLCIASGLFGVQNPFANFCMTFFWIVFVLGVAYAVALIGDFYAVLNPWRAIVDALERVTPLRFSGGKPYPERFGYYPALVLYMAFIWVELYGKLLPRGLAIALLIYTAINLLGAWTYGKQAWFRYGEFFAVFMRLMGRMSPWARPWDPHERTHEPQRNWRAPFVGLLAERAEHMSLVLFILFMLSSTAFDGLHATLPWANVFWKGLYPAIAPLISSDQATAIARSTDVYYVWQWCSLLVSPFVYLGVFLLFVAGVKTATRTPQPVRSLALQFAMTLVPIAFVYHVTHYYTLLIAQVGQLVPLVSDPFGAGWNLFGTARTRIEPMLIDVGTIWHTQVALILVGHIASVYLAHIEALRAFQSPRAATVSQLPMLVLMMIFTTFGLWILSLPLGTGG